jgi:hypothetical protein
VNPATVFKVQMLEFRQKLSAALGLPTTAIHMELERNELTGALHPKLDIKPTDSWLEAVKLPPGAVVPGMSRGELVERFMYATIEPLYRAFREDIKERVKRLNYSRPDIEKTGPVEDVLVIGDKADGNGTAQ